MSDQDQTNSGVGVANILVIDDEEIIHASLRKILSRQGHQVTTTFEASEGLELIDANHFDLIISDLMMPEMNGIELLQQLRRCSVDVPVLMLTGYPTIRTAMQALRLGAVDYLAKPFTRLELLAPINRVLRRSGAGGAGAPPSLTEPPPLGTVEVEAPQLALEPGDRYRLRRHAWATYRQDGAMDVGIEANFLASVGIIEQIEVPQDGDLIEQGHASIRMTTSSRESHGVFMPISGQVLAINAEALEQPNTIDADTWIVRVLPTNLEAELPILRPCS